MITKGGDVTCYSWSLTAKLMSDITLVQNETQSAFTCSKLTIETLEQGVKYVQS